MAHKEMVIKKEQPTANSACVRIPAFSPFLYLSKPINADKTAEITTVIRTYKSMPNHLNFSIVQ